MYPLTRYGGKQRNSSDYGSVIDLWGLNIAIFNRLFIRIFIRNSGPTDLYHRVPRKNRCTAFEDTKRIEAIVGIPQNETVSSLEIRIFTKHKFRFFGRIKHDITVYCIRNV